MRLGTVDAAANQSDFQLRCHDLPRCQDVFEALAAKSGHGFAAGKPLERVDGGVNDVVRVGGANALGEDVLHARYLKDRANRAASDRSEEHTSELQSPMY